jgi:predicted metalloprotease with PDZ domain
MTMTRHGCNPASQRSFHFIGVCVVFVCWALTVAPANSLSAKAASGRADAGNVEHLELTYHFRISRPASHVAEIEIGARNFRTPELDFVMPAWSPGRYAIYDFAKNVQEFEASTPDGRTLPWSQADKQTWRVQTGGASEIRVNYQVFGNDLSGSFSQIDSTHANLNGASIFMYIEGHKPDPIELTVGAPPGWKIISGYSQAVDQLSCKVPNYDRLVDTPLEISPGVTVTQWTDHGKTFRVAVHDYGVDRDLRPALLDKLTNGVKKVVAVYMGMMPPPDFDHYTFLFHFAPDIAAGDGMEHLNSTQIIVSKLLSDGGIDEALLDAAHEFFHLWNVKRLRPVALGPFDYTREDYSPSLWFAEGVTTYYSYLTLLRAGLWTPDDLYKHLASEIQTLETEPGRKLMSAESSSFHAWFYDRSPQMQETNFANSTISYYNKGALLGLLLDLEIRSRTEGRKSLDDLMRLMYGRFYGAPQQTYYLPGYGYAESDILEALNEVSGSDFSDFFKSYVQGTDALSYSETLAKAGLELITTVPAGAPPSLGVLTTPAATGVEITDVLPGGAADRAGLSRDDLLVAVDNFSLATSSLEDRLKIYPPGADVPFTVQRHAEREILAVRLDPPVASQYTIEESPHATPEEVALRRGWLANPLVH